jgi:hypothetical protein
VTEDWDFDHQRAETAHTVETLAEEAGLKPDDRIVLDLQFVPAAEDADRAALEKALRSFGYTLGEADDDDAIAVSVTDVPFTLEAIWEHEERTTRIALARGFEPDGWGFWEP